MGTEAEIESEKYNRVRALTTFYSYESTDSRYTVELKYMYPPKGGFFTGDLNSRLKMFPPIVISVKANTDEARQHLWQTVGIADPSGYPEGMAYNSVGDMLYGDPLFVINTLSRSHERLAPGLGVEFPPLTEDMLLQHIVSLKEPPQKAK